jgi:hypothetical protein
MLARRWPAVTALVGAVVAGGVGVAFEDRIPWLPRAIALYGEEYGWVALRGAGWLMLGALAVVAWSRARHPGQTLAAAMATGALAGVVAALGARAEPVAELLHPGRVRDGVVLQTSAYTCAPAVIATLLRHLGHPAAPTERDVALLTETTRQGTSTLVELRTLERLGVRAELARGLSVGDLLERGAPAILHVEARSSRLRRTLHAVALLAVDAERGTATIGDPLRGRVVTRLDALARIWTGEAIFVGRSRSGARPSALAHRLKR